jgi:signal transduction histidine kinase/CheY-like chemotaxis protein/HAMP domain-containing protein
MTFDDMKLAKKQGSAFGFILLIMTFATLFSLMKMSQVQNVIGQMNTNLIPGLDILYEIRVDLAEYCMQQSSDADFRMNKIRVNMDRYEPLIVSRDERGLYSDLREKWKTYLNPSKSLVPTLQRGNEEKGKSYKEIADILDQMIRIRKGFFDAATSSRDTYNTTKRVTFLILGLTLLLSALIALVLVRTVTEPVRQLETAARRVTAGDYTVHLTIQGRDEIGRLSDSFNLMTTALRKAKEENESRDWFKSGQNELNKAMQGDQDEQSLARKCISCLAKYLNAQVGVLYLFDEEHKELRLAGSYAFTKRKGLGDVIHIGEGIVGQAAFEKEIISVTDIPSDYLRIGSALGDTAPRNIAALPFLYEGRLVGVLELGSFKEFDDKIIVFLSACAENIAVGFNSALSDRKIKYLLQESRHHAEELQTRQEELKAANEELTAQAEALKVSETRLIEQQEELQATNDELEQKARFLAKQKAEIAEKNQHLEAAQTAVKQKAEALESASRYKSEFLANMSHELRTPLNSMLILARSLADNENGNLSEEEVHAAKIIYKGGNDLLKLINEILDLSKIEAGKMSINIDTVPLAGIVENVRNSFEKMMNEKGLELECYSDDTLPKTIQTDQQRLEQIIRNFMSNAVKFTENGTITFSIEQPEADLFHGTAGAQNVIVFSVSDTGIGIPKDKQSDIFEAFQQVNGGTARKYGGTGLGLSISRELAKLLGGEIRLKSETGKGSSFILYLPIDASRNAVPEKIAVPEEPPVAENKVPSFQARQEGNFLIVEDDETMRKSIRQLIVSGGDVKITETSTGKEAIEALAAGNFDCMVLDLGLPDMTGFALLDRLSSSSIPPVIVYTASELTPEQEAQLRRYSETIIVKGPKSEDRLMDEISLFLHRKSRGKKNRRIVPPRDKDSMFSDKKILLADDDMRNVFALSKILSERGMKVLKAEDGLKALSLLDKNPETDLVLMDIMMPVMDGYEAMKKIREQDRFRKLPVIALTAKAMMADRAKCIAAGASDYLTKPVDTERLLSMMRVWLYR